MSKIRPKEFKKHKIDCGCLRCDTGWALYAIYYSNKTKCRKKFFKYPHLRFDI